MLYHLINHILFHARMYTQLSKLISEGKLRPTIDTVFPLSEAAAAHTKAEEGHVRGKLVLHVADIVSA
jgi:NADPH:quinone reductase-like Zn-dependent oxidoreductase